MKKMCKINYLVMDLDGTLTDGKIYMGRDFELFKAFNIKDGYGIRELLPQNNICPIVITARESTITENRCKELNIQHVYQGVSDKSKVLKTLNDKFKFEVDDQGRYKNVAFIGDDMIDLPLVNLCRVSGCPADAVKKIKKKVDYICELKSGEGAVREFIEWIISKNKKDNL